MKRTLLALLLPLAAAPAHAQFQYTLSTQTGQTYTALPATATTVNGTTAWSLDAYKVALPFSFKLNGTQTLTSLGVSTYPFPICADDTGFANDLNGFCAMTAELFDKGLTDTSGSVPVTQSPIRFQVSGTTPNRIAKLEFRNAGFADEYFGAGTADDSVSFQYWFYETTNVVELRYGPSKLANGNTYFFFGNGPTVGFFQGFNVDGEAIQNAYYLKGNASAPTLDSTTSADSLEALNNYPASGTVYRFTPKAATAPNPPGTAVGTVGTTSGISVYPTATSNLLQVSNPSQQALRYTICAATGAVVASGSLPAGTAQAVDVTTLPAGAYLIQISERDARSAFRFTKL